MGANCKRPSDTLHLSIRAEFDLKSHMENTRPVKQDMASTTSSKWSFQAKYSLEDGGEGYLCNALTEQNFKNTFRMTLDVVFAYFIRYEPCNRHRFRRIPRLRVHPFWSCTTTSAFTSHLGWNFGTSRNQGRFGCRNVESISGRKNATGYNKWEILY